MTAINDALLKEFSAGFFGYGSFEAPFWFVGMEEGGGNSIEEINARLGAWVQLGKPELADIFAFHERTGLAHWFAPYAPLQSTWAKAIRILLRSRNFSATRDEVRSYQVNLFGRSGQEACMLDLLPLPSPSTSHWIYATHSGLPWLASRLQYSNTLLPVRVQCLRERVARFRPRAVVFFGHQYLHHWEAIAGLVLPKSPGAPIAVRGLGGTYFIAAKHPVAWGASNAYFDRVGQELAVQQANGADAPFA